MTGATIEILPKTRFEHSSGSLTFKASTPQAIDTSGFNFLSLQVWVYNLQTGDTLKLSLEEATVNEDDAYVPALSAAAPLLTFAGTGSTQTKIVHLIDFSRFIRLTVQPILASGNVVDVRAHLNLKLTP